MADLRLVVSNRFTSVRFEDIEPRDRPYLVKGLIPDRGLVFIAGAPRSGKSFIALDWALRIASFPESEAMPILRRRTKHGPVVYIGAEDAGGLELRIAAWRRQYLSYSSFDFIPHTFDVRDHNAVEELVDLIIELARDREREGPLRAVVIDTFSQLVAGSDESGAIDMSHALKVLNWIGATLQCVVLAVAHTGKDELRGIRGWSGLEAAADVILRIDRDPEQPEQRSITLDKIKNGPDQDVEGFTLKAVSLGIDEDGDPWGSCVPAYSGARSSRRQRTPLSTPARLSLVMRAMRLCYDQEKTIPAPEQAGVRFGTMAVDRLVLKEMLRSIGYTDDDERFDAVKVRINRDLQSLIGAKKIRGTDRCVWFHDDRHSETDET